MERRSLTQHNMSLDNSAPKSISQSPPGSMVDQIGHCHISRARARPLDLVEVVAREVVRAVVRTGGTTGSGSSAGGSSGSGASGSGAGGIPGFAGFNRQTKDTVIITFIPVCIRQEDYPVVGWGHTKTYPIEYVRYDKNLGRNNLSMGVGTPGWANYLPPCNSEQALENRALAPGKAFSTNISLQGISSLISSGIPLQ